MLPRTVRGAESVLSVRCAHDGKQVPELIKELSSTTSVAVLSPPYSTLTAQSTILPFGSKSKLLEVSTDTSEWILRDRVRLTTVHTLAILV